MKIKQIIESKQSLTEAKLVEGSIQLIESVLALLEDFDWEPQPEFRGVKGKTSDTGAGIAAAKQARQAQAGEKTQEVWAKMVRQLPKLDPSHQEKMKAQLKRLAQSAQAKGIKLTPDPSDLPWMRSATNTQFA